MLLRSKPLSQWYFEDTSQWTLDYPPLFAYFEKLLSMLANVVDPKMVTISADPYESYETVIFQRISVILGDSILVYGCYSWSRSAMYTSSNTIALVLFALHHPVSQVFTLKVENV